MDRHASWASTLSGAPTAMTATTSVVTTSARLAALRDHVALARESRGVCEKVLARLHVLNRQLEHMISMSATSTGSNGSGGAGKNQAASQNQRALAKLGELVTQLEEFVDCDATRNLVLRLTDSRRFRQLQDLHEELDAIFRLLRLEHVDPERQWRSEWTLDRDEVERAFQRALATREALFREVATPDAQREALAVLRATLKTLRLQPQTQPPPPVPKPRSAGGASQLPPAGGDLTADLVRTAFRKLVSLASVDMPAIPTWFLSPAEVSIERVPFAGGDHLDVFRATWGRFKTRAALKRLKATDANSGETDGDTLARAALLQEAELWSQLEHPSVLKMHGGCAVGAAPFLVVEYPANGSLDEYLLSSEDPHRATFRLLWQAASGLQYLHERQVVCRDLKLSSLYVGSDGVAKVGQLSSFFRPASASGSAARVVDPKGSIRWKAPELLRDEATPDATDVALQLAVDVYAFAMCIIEAVTGELPWGWISDAEVRDRVLAGEIPDRPETADDRLWGLIASMCDADPAKRPTMASVTKQLLAIAEDEERMLTRGARAASIGGFGASEELIEDEFTSENRRRSPKSMTLLSVDVDELLSARRNTVTSSSAHEEASPATPSISVVTLHHKWLGVKINSIGNRVVVSKFLRSSSGALGEIEASGQVRLGDVVIAVNNRSVRGMDRNQVGQVISSAPRPMQVMFLRDNDLLEECFQFHGLRLEERWRDRGAIVPMPNGVEVTFGSIHDMFTFSIWFSLNDSDDTFCGGILLGAQDMSCHDPAWPYCHHQLVMVDPHGNLCSFFLHNETPVLIGRELQPNRWYHMAVVYNSRGVTVYLDGEIKHQANGILYREWSRLSHLNIGSGCISHAPPAAKPDPDFCGWYGFNGLIHDACVWHKEMSEVEVQRLFRGSADLVDTPVYSLRRDIDKEGRGLHPPRRVMASRPHHVVAQMYS